MLEVPNTFSGSFQFIRDKQSCGDDSNWAFPGGSSSRVLWTTLLQLPDKQDTDLSNPPQTRDYVFCFGSS